MALLALSLPHTLMSMTAQDAPLSLGMTLGIGLASAAGIWLARAGMLNAGAMLVNTLIIVALSAGAMGLKDLRILGFSSLALLSGAFVLPPRLVMALLTLQLVSVGVVSAYHGDLVHDAQARTGLVFLALSSLALTSCGYIFRRFSQRTMSELWQTTEQLHAARAQAERARQAAEDAAREALTARARAEEASLAKSRFLATMSHELRTPLNAIIGYAEMIEEEAQDDEATDRLAQDARHIHGSGRHLLRLISDILDLSKIEAGQMSAHVEPFDVEDLLREIQGAMQPLVRKNQNTLTLEVALASSSMYQDRLKLQQILTNLLSNAAKFTERGQITLRAMERGRALIFEVQDTGIGISAEAMGRLFEPFVQADSSTTRKYGGTGLGLALCKQLAQLLDGELSCDSQVGQGTRFTLRVPRKDARAELSTMELTRMSFSRRALLVGPDPQDNALHERALKREGWSVASAQTRAEALRLARTFNPHAIVLDLRQPEGELGFELLKQLGQAELTPKPSLFGVMEQLDLSRLSTLGASGLRADQGVAGIVSALGQAG